MHDLAVIRSKQDAATMKEYREAIEDGDIDRAQRIAWANPDLFPGGKHSGTHNCRKCGRPMENPDLAWHSHCPAGRTN